MNPETKLLATLGISGALIGLAQILSSDNKVTWRIGITRAVLSGALGISAAAAGIFVENLSFPAQVGLACILSSLGTSALEKLLQRVVNR